MIINFVGNYQTGVGGEAADETHLARELESLGHTVRRIPRDEWREHVIHGSIHKNVPEKLHADMNIICKWHHFYDGSFISELKRRSGAPVFYWVWDYMYDMGIPQWHLDAIEASDLYLGNDVRCGKYPAYLRYKLYYFNFDVVDGDMATHDNLDYTNEVVFLGNFLQQGNRLHFLKEINNHHRVKIYSATSDLWREHGFDAYDAVYGEEANKVIASSKINLGFSVEPHCWGYWSNRLGRTLFAGGFLLYEYAPAMESFTGSMDYFSSVKELREKIDYYLTHDEEREKIRESGRILGRNKFTSKQRVKELEILIKMFLNRNKKSWKI